MMRFDKVTRREQVEEMLAWDVEQAPLQLEDGTSITSHVANLRSIDGLRHVLGVVGKSYQVIQNQHLLDLGETICQQQKLTYSMGGILGHGERVFFQCAGQPFSVGKGDEIVPYMLFANSHDGSMACRMLPMTERLVCSNQLANIVKKEESWVSIRHTGSVGERLAEAGRLAQHFMTVIQANRVLMLQLRKRQVTAKKMAKFFRDMYLGQVREVTTTPDSHREDLARERAHNSFLQYEQRFQAEQTVAGHTTWNMANAYTGWLQHDHRAGRDPLRSAKRRLESSLFGLLAQRSVEAFQAALTY